MITDGFSMATGEPYLYLPMVIMSASNALNGECRSKPFLLPFGDCIQLRSSCPCACNIGTVWTCSGVARLIDNGNLVLSDSSYTPLIVRFCTIDRPISVSRLVSTACTMERGLSSDSKSVSSPPHPPRYREAFHISNHCGH